MVGNNLNHFRTTLRWVLRTAIAGRLSMIPPLHGPTLAPNGRKFAVKHFHRFRLNESKIVGGEARDYSFYTGVRPNRTPGTVTPCSPVKKSTSRPPF